MRIPTSELPAVAKNGFFICTSKKYGQWTAVAPVRETAKTLLCCAVQTKTVREDNDGNYIKLTVVPGDEFFACQDDVHVYSVRKGEYPKERVVTVRDAWTW